MRDYLEQYFKRYPKSQIQDFLKTVYQASFGSGHLISDKTKSLQNLKDEVRSIDLKKETTYLDLYEYIGPDYVRLNLKPYLQFNLSVTTLHEMFFESSSILLEDTRLISDDLEILKIFLIEKGFDKATVILELEDYTNKNYPLIRHSDYFKENYDPHYRLIHRKYLTEDLKFYQSKNFIDNLLKNDLTIIAIDGKTCSGKSTLANLLAKECGATIIHADHFFDSSNDAIGINSERLRTEVLEKLRVGKSLTYSKYICSIKTYEDVYIEKVNKLVIIEGSFCACSELREFYNAMLLIDIDKDTQLERLNIRSKPLLNKFIEIWIPRENTYLDYSNIIRVANLIV